jgi:hypothetical protein
VTRYLVRLALIGVVIGGTGLAVVGFGYSGSAAVLAMVLAAALTWVPTLLALEGISKLRNPGTMPPAQGGSGHA